jgi:hypothetical protein
MIVIHKMDVSILKHLVMMVMLALKILVTQKVVVNIPG